MKFNISFIDEDRPEIDVTLEELKQEPQLAQGFLVLAYADGSSRLINTTLIAEIISE